MSVTKQLSPEGMEEYFDRFSKRFLKHETTNVADVEMVSLTLGDQVATDGAHLVGITYDPKRKSLELELESGDMRAYEPKEVWAVEEDDGFVRTIEIIRADDTREIVTVRRLAVRRAD